jgi:hypothetical protein
VLSDSSELEADYERGFARDRSLLQTIDHATLGASVFILAVLLTLVIPLGRTSPFLIGLSLYAFATRMSVFVARYALGTPAFLLEVDSADTSRSTAARRVFEQHREIIALDLLSFANERPSATAIAALTPEAAASIARKRDPAARRRWGTRWLAAWVTVSIAIWAAIFVTGGGPTN